MAYLQGKTQAQAGSEENRAPTWRKNAERMDSDFHTVAARHTIVSVYTLLSDRTISQLYQATRGKRLGWSLRPKLAPDGSVFL